MGGQWIPEGILSLQPAWHNFTENVATVQFQHRVLAIVLLILIPLFWFFTIRTNPAPRLKTGLHLMLFMIVVQVILGISTLVLSVPISLAAAHQAGMVLLITAMLYVTHQIHQHR
jgi:cytochrome c oxidase assembly protein subunit 15